MRVMVVVFLCIMCPWWAAACVPTAQTEIPHVTTTGGPDDLTTTEEEEETTVTTKSPSSSSSSSSTTTTSPTTTTTTTSSPCPAGWTFHVNGLGTELCYAMLNGPVDSCDKFSGCDGFSGGCDDARVACASFGGVLGSIHSQEDDDFILGLSDPEQMVTLTLQPEYSAYDYSVTQQTCIGLRTTGSTGSTDQDNYFWQDMSERNFWNWIPPAPNTGSAQEPCVILYSVGAGGWNGRWDNFPCAMARRNAICQIEPLETP